MTSIGVAITHHNRPDMFARCVTEWFKYHDGPMVVVDDGSENNNIPPEDHRYELIVLSGNHGIAYAKNRALAALADMGVEHAFLSDDDTWPMVDDWADAYVASPEPHLSFGFADGPAHWRTTATVDGDLTVWDKPRGCLLYAHLPTVLPVVGGMSTAFGKHGAEHGNWSDRIHAAGLTRHRYADVSGRPRFYCADMDQAGISSVDFKANDGWKHVDASRIPTYCEYRERHIPVLVPRRNDHGHRDRLWRFVQDTFWAEHPLYRAVEGHHVEGPFNRSLAVNLAADIAGNWDVAIVADSDAWVPAKQLTDAVKLARQTNRLVAAFTEVHEVGEKDTLAILNEGFISDDVAVEKVRSKPLETQSVMLAVPRNLWEQVRGFDPRHVGWGGEDNAFWAACTIATGEPLRVDGPAFTLWHEPATREHQRSNAARFDQYRRARTLADIHWLRA